jgi:circadian clock protein KaiB
MNPPVAFKFLLYVAGGTQNSSSAVANLMTVCRTHLPERHGIEVIDVFREPKRALADGILMTPTLIKLSPGPVRRIIGTLSDTHSLLMFLEFPLVT